MIIESVEVVELNDGNYSGRLGGKTVAIKGIVKTTRFKVNYDSGDVSYPVRVEVKDKKATINFKYR